MISATAVLIAFACGCYVNHWTQTLRIKDYKFFSDTRLKDYKEAFNLGFQTQNGHQPFREEAKLEDKVVSSDVEFGTFYGEEEEEENFPRRERWDD